MNTGFWKYVSAVCVCDHCEEGCSVLRIFPAYSRANQQLFQGLYLRAWRPSHFFFFFNLLNMTVFTKGKVIEVQEIEAKCKSVISSFHK